MKFKKKTKTTPSPQEPATLAGHHDRLNKRQLLLVSLLLVTILGATGVYLLQSEKREADSTLDSNTSAQMNDDSVISAIDSVCSEDLMLEANKYMPPGNNQELKSIVDSIFELEGYEKDPNCLIVITTYYVNLSDPLNTRKYYEELNKVFNQNIGYSPIIAANSLTPEQLKSVVDFLEQQSEQIKANRIYGPAV